MPAVLLVEEDPSLRARLRSRLESEGFDVEAAADGEAAVAALRARSYVAAVVDLEAASPWSRGVLEAARATACETVARSDDPSQLLDRVRRAVERRLLLRENLRLRSELAERLGFPRIIGQSAALAEATRQLRKVAATEATVLLQGEPGTGKELFARAIHHLSARRDGPFVTVHCAGVPEALLEVELFGLDAREETGPGGPRPGRIELADRGTLFLGEVGETGSRIQGRLLELLEQGRFERDGEGRTVPVDLRVIASTSRDPRDDLLFRRAAVTVTAPPLRARDGDIVLLAGHFLESFGCHVRGEPLVFSPESLEAIRTYAWPGNVRELERAVERAVLLADGERIEPRHLGLGSPHDRAGDEAGFCRVVGMDGTLDEVGGRARELAERIAVRRALRATRGSAPRAARALRTSEERVRALGIAPAADDERLA